MTQNCETRTNHRNEDCDSPCPSQSIVSDLIQNKTRFQTMHHLNVNNVELETLPPWSCFRFDLVFYCIFDWLWESLSIQSIKIQTYSSYFQPCYSSHSTYHILIIMSVSHSSVLKFISWKLMVKSSCKKSPRIRFVWYSNYFKLLIFKYIWFSSEFLSSQTGGIVEDAYFMIGIGNKQSFARKIKIRKLIWLYKLSQK